MKYLDFIVDYVKTESDLETKLIQQAVIYIN